MRRSCRTCGALRVQRVGRSHVVFSAATCATAVSGRAAAAATCAARTGAAADSATDDGPAGDYAGRGQRYYIFGSAASFVDLVAYYRAALKDKGEMVFDVPATHEFDVGKFNENTMAFPPGVTIKDFQSDVSQGYPNPKAGGQPARFPTIIQIVPVTGR
jgi:hypothetical protein